MLNTHTHMENSEFRVGKKDRLSLDSIIAMSYCNGGGNVYGQKLCYSTDTAKVLEQKEMESGGEASGRHPHGS